MTESQEKKLDSVHDSIAELRNAIIGNEKYKIKGIAQKVDEHDEKFKSYDTIKNKGIGALAGLSFVGGLTGWGIIEWFKHLMK